MLNWWLGKASIEGAILVEDGSDPPDTPAPVFAARAFKSAIFGTPNPLDDDELDVPDQAKDNAALHRRANSTAGITSPAKPQGILLTPGTITRRKTVSFGAAVIEKENKNALGRSGLPSDFPGKFPSPWPAKVEPVSQSTRRTALTRSLESARDGKSKKSSSNRGAGHSAPLSFLDLEQQAAISGEVEKLDGVQQSESVESRTASSIEDSFDGDMTVDLNEPHSQSGKYWKSEYERYHEEAKQQMKKLVKYKHLAKSYAKKKDCEAIDLGGKLKEEQEKVKIMEDKITKLVAQIAERRIAGNDEDAPELMKDLARQTAIAVQYRDQVDQFEAAMRERDYESDRQCDSDGQKSLSPRTAETLVEISHELKKAREKLQEMSSLRAEMHSLRLSLSAAERKAARLHEENSKLVRELANANADLEKSEKRRQSADFLSKKRDDLLVGLHKNYDDLKEKAKLQRQEAQDLLKKRHDQVSGLKKELVALKSKPGTEEPRRDLRRREEMGTIPSRAANPAADDLMSMETPPKGHPRTTATQGSHGLESTESWERAGSLIDRSAAINQPSLRIREDFHLLDSKIPVSHGSTLKSQNDRAPARPTSSDEPRSSLDIPQPKHPALSDIINDTTVPNSPRLATAPLSVSLQERFSSLSLESPKIILPSSETSDLSSTSHAVHDKRGSGVPRAPMANNGSNTKRTPLTSESAVHKENSTNAGNPACSRLSSLSSNRARTSLPPDRAAAAKARLEQRNAEKKLAQRTDYQKENVCP